MVRVYAESIDTESSSKADEVGAKHREASEAVGLGDWLRTEGDNPVEAADVLEPTPHFPSVVSLLWANQHIYGLASRKR